MRRPVDVYPAAGLINYVKPHKPKYLIDPNECKIGHLSNLNIIKENAGTGVPKLVDELLKNDYLKNTSVIP